MNSQAKFTEEEITRYTDFAEKQIIEHGGTIKLVYAVAKIIFGVIKLIHERVKVLEEKMK